MTQTRLPLVMLLGLAALALLSGCAGAAPTPTQALQAAEEQAPAQPVVVSATPTPTPTPEPTATPTETSTPTPEATPTPDAEAIVRRIREKVEAQFGAEKSVSIFRMFDGRQAGKYNVAFVTGEMMKWLEIAPELRALLDQGADVTVVLYVRNLGYYIQSSGQSLSGLKAAFCVPLRRGALSPVVGDERKVTPLDATARTYLAAKSTEYRETSDLVGIRGTNARGVRFDEPGLASVMINISWGNEEVNIFFDFESERAVEPDERMTDSNLDDYVIRIWQADEQTRHLLEQKFRNCTLP